MLDHINQRLEELRTLEVLLKQSVLNTRPNEERSSTVIPVKYRSCGVFSTLPWKRWIPFRPNARSTCRTRRFLWYSAPLCFEIARKLSPPTAGASEAATNAADSRGSWGNPGFVRCVESMIGVIDYICAYSNVLQSWDLSVLQASPGISVHSFDWRQRTSRWSCSSSTSSCTSDCARRRARSTRWWRRLISGRNCWAPDWSWRLCEATRIDTPIGDIAINSARWSDFQA